MNLTTLLSVAENVSKFGDGIETAEMGEKVVFSLQVVLIGMGVVFGVLLLLIGILQLFKLFEAKDNVKKEAPVASAPVATSANAAPVAAGNTNSDEALVAAIAASAIAAANGKNDVDFNILSITPIGSAKPVSAPASAPAAAPTAPVAEAKAESAPAPAPAATAAPADGEKITAPLPGNVLDVKVSVGASVKKGDILCILEAMKMENEIVAPCDGTVATVAATKGATVNTGDLLFVIG